MPRVRAARPVVGHLLPGAHRAPTACGSGSAVFMQGHGSCAVNTPRVPGVARAAAVVPLGACRSRIDKTLSICPEGATDAGHRLRIRLGALASRSVISESSFPPGNLTQNLSVPARGPDQQYSSGSAQRALPLEYIRNVQHMWNPPPLRKVYLPQWRRHNAIHVIACITAASPAVERRHVRHRALACRCVPPCPTVRAGDGDAMSGPPRYEERPMRTSPVPAATQNFGLAQEIETRLEPPKGSSAVDRDHL
jgi:hypothetical protein